MFQTSAITTAYRADLGGRDEPLGPGDGSWLVVGSVLEHAASIPRAHRPALLENAVQLAHEAIPPIEVARRKTGEWSGVDAASTDVIVLLSDDAQENGALRTASMLLDLVMRAAEPLTAIQRGRVLAKQARIAWKVGDLDAALSGYQRVARLGRATGSLELKARASIGFAALAQMRRDYQRVLAHARRGGTLAKRAGLLRLVRQAYNGLTIVAGLEGRLDDALTYGWKVFEASAGNATEEAEALQNIGQSLFDGGYADDAQAAFALVVTRRIPYRIMLPGLGGFALASAARGNQIGVQWAARQIERLVPVAGQPYAEAAALEECATAASTAGLHGLADGLHAQAMAIADVHGFAALSGGERRRADTGAGSSAGTGAGTSALALRRDAAMVARRVRAMAPRRLPKHVSPLAASA